MRRRRHRSSTHTPAPTRSLVLAHRRAAKLATQLRDARRATEVATNAKDQFLAMLSHELRNPLTPIVNALNLIRRTVAPSSFLDRQLDMVERQATNLTRIIDGLLDVSRATNGPASRAGGADLGDALARAIKGLVEMHGGTVETLSSPRGGSELVVHLPGATPAAQATSAPPRETPSFLEAGSGRRVLVVDDDNDTAESMAELIQSLGYDVRVALDGPTALRTCEEWNPELVFLDIALPGMSGYEVAREIRKKDPRRPILVALTGYGQESDRRQSRQAGFALHIVKPPRLEALETVLAALSSNPAPHPARAAAQR